MITAPVSLRADGHAWPTPKRSCRRHSISGVPITDDAENRLVGILTNRDIRFCTEAEYHRPVTDFMTGDEPGHRARRAPRLTTPWSILHQHRIEKLPLVDPSGPVAGPDHREGHQQAAPEAERPALDGEGRLRVGAAIGVERCPRTQRRGPGLMPVSTCSSSTPLTVTAGAWSTRWPRSSRSGQRSSVVGGNVVTREGVERSRADAGVDVVKVGRWCRARSAPPGSWPGQGCRSSRPSTSARLPPHPTGSADHR